jgi:hypothetical protein
VGLFLCTKGKLACQELFFVVIKKANDYAKLFFVGIPIELHKVGIFWHQSCIEKIVKNSSLQMN